MSANKKLIFQYDQKKLGSGDVIYCWQPGDRLLAFCGENRVVSIVDKMGVKSKDFPLKFGGKCKYMEFDNLDGDTLAIFQDKCSIVTIINIFTEKTLDLEINRSNKDFPTCLRWTKNSNILFVGTHNGMIYFYNKKNDKITPVSMSHSAPIISGDWNLEGNLVTGDEKKTLSVTNTKGEALLQNALMKFEPRNLQWARQKTNETKKEYTTISTIQNNKTILIYDFKKKSNPIELALDSEYGNIVTYEWFGDGYIAIGFSKGYISIVSSHMEEVKNEINSKQLFKNGLDDLSVCDEVNRIAVAGENTIKILDKNSFTEITDEKISIPANAGRISKICWSKSGQILLVSTFLGNIYAFNVVINETFAICGNLFSSLMSINEVSAFMLEEGQKKKIYDIELRDEPQTFELSNTHFAAAIGNKVEVFITTDEKGEFLPKIGPGKPKEFSGQIKMISLNDNYMSVLCDDKVHLIDLQKDTTEKIFPIKDTEDKIIFISMTDDYLIYSDSKCHVKIFAIMDNCNIVGDYKFDHVIKKIYPNDNGTKYICIDELGKVLVYSPVTETVLQIYDELPGNFNRAIWDKEDPNVFIGIDSTNTKIYSFNLILNSLQGPYIRTLKEMDYLEDLDKEKVSPVVTTVETGSYPFLLESGSLFIFHKQDKEISNVILNSHYWLFNWKKEGDSQDGHKKFFIQNYLLEKYQNSLLSVKFLDESEREAYYDRLGKEALNNLNIEIAAEAFRLAKNISLVLTVQQLANETEKKVLLGHIAAILGKEDLAQELFVASSQPEKALDLRMDLQDWDVALKLAKEYNKNKEPFISRKLAYQYETQSNIPEACTLYENSYITNPTEFIKKINDDYDINDLELHNQQCIAGISRCAFRIGDTEKGINKAKDITDKNLVIEIATLCENLHYDLESAKLFTQVGLYEKAAIIYIRLKLFKSAEDLMDKIKSPKLLTQLAKMKEAEGLYQDAEKAYITACDWENAIRVNLQFLNNPEKARDLLMNHCKTESAASLMSNYYESKGKKKETIEYKLIARKYNEAFAIAQTYNEMETYADYMLKNNKSPDEFKKIASFYEGRFKFGEAGVFYEKIGEFQKALKMYTKSNEDKYLEKSIEMVGQIKDENLINELIDYFLVESKNPKAHHFLTKLYILLDNFKQACDIAITLASDEQKFSKYNEAHQILLDIYMNLKDRNLPVSYELNHRLSILHSYRIAKKFIKLKQEMKAARNLLKVANNITMFEEDKVKIMTIVAVECQKAGLHRSSSLWAVELMKDHKPDIPQNYQSSISKIARKTYKNEDEPMPAYTPCPFCKKDLLEYDLECKSCYNVIPFCIASGKHVVLKDLAKCSHCNFPFNIPEMQELLVNEVKCPMCDAELDPKIVERINDPTSYLKSRKVAVGSGGKE